jgi:hypothetical protein
MIYNDDSFNQNNDSFSNPNGMAEEEVIQVPART